MSRDSTWERSPQNAAGLKSEARRSIYGLQHKARIRKKYEEVYIAFGAHKIVMHIIEHMSK